MFSSRHSNRHFIVGVVILFVGVVLLLDQLGFVASERIFQFWPLILIYFGVNRLTRHPGTVGWFWGGFLILLGISFQLQEFGLRSHSHRCDLACVPDLCRHPSDLAEIPEPEPLGNPSAPGAFTWINRPALRPDAPPTPPPANGSAAGKHRLAERRQCRRRSVRDTIEFCAGLRPGSGAPGGKPGSDFHRRMDEIGDQDAPDGLRDSYNWTRKFVLPG